MRRLGGGVECDQRAHELADPARAGGRANSEPMLARTAFGENGSAQPGPSTTGPSASAWADRMTAPTLPGSPTPCR